MSIKKILTERTLTLLTFFAFFITSLFLGDGKQPFVDAWWALGILTMFALRYYRRGKFDFSPVPRPIGVAWIVLILYNAILIPFSDSAGYSISATIRLIEGYLIYVLFAGVQHDHTGRDEDLVGLFGKGIIITGVVATLASFLFLARPNLARFLPPMNLLYANYGHNHLADLLLIVTPMAIGLVEKKKSVWSVGTLALLLVGMIFTFARGAWILLGLYLLLFVVRSKNPSYKRVGLFIITIVVAAIITVSLFSFHGTPKSAGLMVRLSGQIQKPSFLEDGRWEYWRQAVEAMKERPLFGSGPGTFYLESKRLQIRSSSWSWFAHSFPLQVIVESGLLGLVMFVVLICVLFRNIRSGPLSTGIVLVFLYGLYEFSLDYATIWLLMFLALGTLARSTQESGINLNHINKLLLVIVASYYVSYVGSATASVGGYKHLAFYLAPYHVGVAKDALEQIKSTNTIVDTNTLKLLKWFHPKNPEVLFAISQIQLTDAFGCERVVPMDKKHKEFVRQCLRALYVEKKYKNIGAIIYELGKDLVTEDGRGNLLPGDFHDEDPYKRVDSQTIERALVDAVNEKQEYAKLIYFIGLEALTKDPKKTKRLWLVARDVSPGWSYYHVELASLEAWILNDRIAARRTLARCAELSDPREHCVYVLTHAIPPPGYQSKQITAIPNTL